MTTRTLRIATRKSSLALWQTEHVAQRLRAAHPEITVELLPLSTRGDEVLDRSLAEIGGKGLFLKELEIAMLEGRADLAVHSLKDMPADLDEHFALAAVLDRADAADAFVSNRCRTLAELPTGARVGTSSLRRRAQLMAARPDLGIRDLRGNVNTRLRKLDEGQYDAIILAVAGLARLGFADRIASRLSPPDWLPAPGQAAIAIECRAGDTDVLALLGELDDAATHRTTAAERAMNRALGGSCIVPVAAWCEVAGDALTLRGLVGDVATGLLVRAVATGTDADALGRHVAQLLLEQGAAKFLPGHC